MVIDECGYEGDHRSGLGQPHRRRSWCAAAGRAPSAAATSRTARPISTTGEELFWSKGGELVGNSPARIGFLTTLIAESPTGTLEPLDMGRNNWDVPYGGVSDLYYLAYFGFNQPRYRHLSHAARASRTRWTSSTRGT